MTNVEYIKCPYCNGTGYSGPTGDTCQACEGSGEYEIVNRDEEDEE